MIADLQSERMDEQRAQLPGVAGRRPTQNGAASGTTSKSSVTTSHVSQPQLHMRSHLPAASDDAFLDMLIRCQVNRRKSRDSYRIRSSYPYLDLLHFLCIDVDVLCRNLNTILNSKSDLQ